MVSSQRDAELADVFVMLAAAGRDGHDSVDVMDTLIQESTRYTSASAAAILLADRAGILHVAASTDERTSDAEEAQLGFDQGPCLDCFRSGEPVGVVDLSNETGRWPQFVELAQSRGFTAVHAVPLRLRGHTLGAMNLFSTGRRPFSRQDMTLALTFARLAAISLLQQQLIQHQATVNGQLQYALDSRVVIEQAKGILAQRYRIPIDEAFVLLRTYARSTNSRLHDAADNIVNHDVTLTSRSSRE